MSLELKRAVLPQRSRAKRWLAAAAFAGLSLFACTPVQAHLVTTGLGPLYDGFGHFALSPDTWLPLIALAITAGLRGPTAGRWVLFSVTFAWVVGDVAAHCLHAPPDLPFNALACLILGILAAANPPLSAGPAACIAAAAGILLGFVNTQAILQADGQLLWSAGNLIFAFVVVAITAGTAVSLKQKWTKIAARVAGSWIGATGLLLIGWALRGSLASRP
jgi:hydrogenase/urease accessory protein HupE